MYERKILGVDEAHHAVEAMIQEVRSKPDYYWQHACCAVVDYNGIPISLARMDESNKLALDMALRKAYTAVMWGRDVALYLEMIKRREWDEKTFGPDYTICPGGLIIVPPGVEQLPGQEFYITNHVIGGIGVSSAGPWTKDEQVAMAGLKYIQNALWPSK